MEQPYIVYSLSASRASQKFNKNTFEQILGDIHVFFSKCTTGEVNTPQSIELTAFSALDDSDPADQLNLVIDNTTKQFGASKKSPVSFHYPTGEPCKADKHEWTVPVGKFRDAVDYLSRTPMPSSKLGPIQLFITYHFKLVDPITKKELPDQKNDSLFCIWFSKSKSISPTLFFPFESTGQEFWNYVDNIANYLPFKLEEKYLRIALPNKRGEIKSFKKITR